MQLVVSPGMKAPITDSLHRPEGGLEVIKRPALVQQDHNLQDPWATGDLLFAGHLSRTLRHSLPGPVLGKMRPR